MKVSNSITQFKRLFGKRFPQKGARGSLFDT